MVKCGICDGEFGNSPDSLVLCSHKQGTVHLGCCIHNCSWHMAPCEHCIAVYDKLGKGK